MTRVVTLRTSPESNSVYDGLNELKYAATVENSHLLLSWSWFQRENGYNDTMGTPSLDRVGRTSGWENSSKTVDLSPLLNNLIVVATSSDVVTSISLTLINHAPQIRLRHSGIFAAGVLDAMFFRCSRLPDLWNSSPAVLWFDRSNLRMSIVCKNASWYGLGDM
jgi:hypothetical protein